MKLSEALKEAINSVLRDDRGVRETAELLRILYKELETAESVERWNEKQTSDAVQ